MRIRETIVRILSRGEVTEDPDELVEIAIIPLAMGPMSVEALRAEGFDARGAPTYNVATGIASDYRVLTPRREASAAAGRLELLR